MYLVIPVQTNRGESIDADTTADPLAADLRAHLAGETVSARRLGKAALWARVARRHRIAVAFAATVFGLPAELAGMTGLMAVRVASERDVALAAQQREARARAAVEHEAARAQAVAGFLEALLENEDPWRAPSDDVSVRELLNLASARVEGELKPEDRPVIRLTLARGYENLGVPEAAEAELHAALRTLDSAGPESDPRRVAVLTGLSMLHHMQGQSP
jgi:hypothetical protein